MKTDKNIPKNINIVLGSGHPHPFTYQDRLKSLKNVFPNILDKKNK